MSSSHGRGDHEAFASTQSLGRVLQNNADSASYSSNDYSNNSSATAHSTPNTTAGPGPCLIDSDGKRFRTAYGTVMWPTLPGLTASQTLPAPAAEPPSAETLYATIGLPPGAARAEKGEREGGSLAGSSEPIARPISSDAWSVNPPPPGPRGRTRGGTGGGAKQKSAAKPNVCVRGLWYTCRVCQLWLA